MPHAHKSDYRIAQQQILVGIIAGEFDIENRKDLGPMIPIRLFQALRMVALGSNVEDILGQGAPSLVYHSGQSLGLAMGQLAAANIDKDLETYVGKIKLLCPAQHWSGGSG